MEQYGTVRKWGFNKIVQKDGKTGENMEKQQQNKKKPIFMEQLEQFFPILFFGSSVRNY